FGGAAGEQANHFAPRRRHGDARLGHLVLDGFEPGAIVRSFLEQSVAAAHRLFVVGGTATMAGIDRENQPVEKAAPVRGWTGERAVRRRRGPDEAGPSQQRLGRALIGSVDTEAAAALARVLPPLQRPGANFRITERTMDAGVDRKAVRRAAARDLCE